MNVERGNLNYDEPYVVNNERALNGQASRIRSYVPQQPGTKPYL